MTRNTKKPMSKALRKSVKKIILEHEKETVELKYFDTDSVLAGLDNNYNSTLTSLCQVPQDNTDRGRNGDRICPIALEFNYWLNSETFTSIYRVIVFRWLPSTTPSAGNIVHSNASVESVITQLVHDGRNQFNILYDKVHHLSNNGNEVIAVRKRLKLARKQIDFSSGTTTGSNKIYCMFATDRLLATSGIGLLSCRFTFIDP